MAQSPAHRFGQILGETLEAAVLLLLKKFAKTHRLYLDHRGTRPCRSGTKCTWLDHNGNKHDLDFVLERGGSRSKPGMPAAFIETAWRRYTKHSRSKVQEIQGAIEPLAETYRNSWPFKGAILAGVFTAGALSQLKSLGFVVLYFPYESVVEAFRKFGIDAGFDEHTAEADFQTKVDIYQRLSGAQRQKIADELIKSRKADVKQFVTSLAVSVSRQIERIVILALHGGMHEVASVDEAIRFIETYADDGRAKPIDRYEIQVRYNNGDAIQGKFHDKPTAVEFLKSYQPIPPRVV
jgi:hypothetical protein